MTGLLFPRHFSTGFLLQADFSLPPAKQEWTNSFFGGDASTFCSVLCLGPTAHQGTALMDLLPS